MTASTHTRTQLAVAAGAEAAINVQKPLGAGECQRDKMLSKGTGPHGTSECRRMKGAHKWPGKANKLVSASIGKEAGQVGLGLTGEDTKCCVTALGCIPGNGGSQVLLHLSQQRRLPAPCVESLHTHIGLILGTGCSRCTTGSCSLHVPAVDVALGQAGNTETVRAAVKVPSTDQRLWP